MHIHPNQINPNMQLDSLYAAEKAAAKRDVERTRKKLLESASRLAAQADSEDCIVKLGARDQAQKQQSQKKQSVRKKSTEQLSSGNADKSISDWA